METLTTPILTGKEGSEWDLEEAASWTKNYRDKHPGETVSHFFGREILEKILAQDGCVGLRFYHGYDEKGKKHLIITGTAADGEDHLGEVKVGAAAPMVKSAAPMTADQTVGQESMPCPGSPGCPKNTLTGG